MLKKTQTYSLVALLLVLAGVVYWNSNSSGRIPGASMANAKFAPLKVDDPKLRLDLLDRVRHAEYKGSNHNIFSYAPPPPTAAAAKAIAEKEHGRHFVGPLLPPPPPPLTLPVTFFGYATNPRTQNRLAFFTNNDDVFIVGEGGTLLNRFRLLKIGNSSADVEEIASGRRATVEMTQPEEQHQ